MNLPCWSRVCSVLLCVLAVPQRSSGYYDSHDSSSSTNAQLRTVNERLEILTNEVSRLADAVDASKNSKVHPVDPGTLVAINRTPGPDGNTFTIFVKKNVQELYYDIIVKYHKIAASAHDEQPDGTCSFTFVCTGNCKRESEIEVLLTNKIHSSSMSLTLNNDGTRALFQDRFTVPTLVIQHSGDLVYDEQRDVELKVYASYGDDKGFSDLRYSLEVVDLNTRKLEKQENHEWIKKLDRKRFLETEETTLEVMTSERNVSGLLKVSVKFTDSDAPLVKTLKVERSIEVRPRDMDETFPEGFVEFKDEGGHVFEGVIYKKCQEGSSCLVDCNAVGTSIQSMTVTQQVAGDQWEPVPDAEQFDFQYFEVLQWAVHPTAESEDMKFRCTALTATANVSQDVTVLISSEEFYIDRNRSSIETAIDEHHRGYENVTIKCTIVGRPVVISDLDLNIGHNIHILPIPDREQVLSDHGRETVLTATINFNPTWRRFEDFHGAACRAYGDGRADYFELVPSHDIN
ncbi:hypothetical protein EGW08_001364 [Elysia chlorotica]|uniref:Uncharacterized protein n=1 Tax=Elysia chlorotica TaxID=188477 RepID=A0A3S0ZZV4_ELYCH|nr:hypothetical protein EGW08_001364 [Elysia chlorotica]